MYESFISAKKEKKEKRKKKKENRKKRKEKRKKKYSACLDDELVISFLNSASLVPKLKDVVRGKKWKQ